MPPQGLSARRTPVGRADKQARQCEQLKYTASEAIWVADIAVKRISWTIVCWGISKVSTTNYHAIYTVELSFISALSTMLLLLVLSDTSILSVVLFAASSSSTSKP